MADGDQPAGAHLSGGCKHPCDFSHVRQRQSDESVTSIFEQSMNNLQVEHPDFLVGQWAIFVSSQNASTSSGPGWISHFTGSFVGHSPSEVLCPPAWLVVGFLEQSLTHTHTCTHGPAMQF